MQWAASPLNTSPPTAPLQVQQYGSIPSALPDYKCYGDFVSPSLAVQQVPAALQDLVGTLQKVSTAGRWLEILTGQ